MKLKSWGTSGGEDGQNALRVYVKFFKKYIYLKIFAVYSITWGVLDKCF